ncbi:MAG: hypothetical protein IKU62_05060 [Ruminiclostridium sp.]|nr:hypothetical protein [Ruminiclostridium sp.]
MKKFLSLILCLGLMGLTAACGGSSEPDPESVPAPEIVDTETIRADPFAAYFDLSGLRQETLDGAIQEVNLDTTVGGITVQLLQTLSDGQNFYAAFDVNWPEGSDPSAEVVEASLTAMMAGYYGEVTGSVADNTGSYIAAFYNCCVPQGADLSLIVSAGGQELTLSWTGDNVCQMQPVTLQDSEGTEVGFGNLTPFSLQFIIYDSYIGGIGHGDTIQLLDETGEPLPETWAISGDVSATFLEFFVPMELGTVKTLQVGPYTAHF